MRFRDSFLREVERFDRCNRQPGSPVRTERGVEQFHAFESRGEVPENPDSYFTHLCNGKAWWEWTLNEYKKMLFTAEWPGWECLQHDFRDDPAGFNQLRQRCGLPATT